LKDRPVSLGLTGRLARLTAGATLVLIAAGGLVTATGAGLAVPDWPTTFGENLFLFPWARLAGGVLVEHTHRLLGATVGVLTLALGVSIWLRDRDGRVRSLAAGAVGLVALQGLVGGLRVVLREDVLGLLHGCLAPAFFAVTVALAVVTGPTWRTGPASRSSPGLAVLATVVSLFLYGQIVLGALATHAGWALTHVGGAIVATGAGAVLAGAALADRDAGLAGLGWGLGGLLVLQVALGLGAYLARFTEVALPGGEAAGLGFAVAHRVGGAGLLGASVALTLRAWRAGLPAATAADRVDPGLVTTRIPA
jgi:heme a synthase